MNSPNSEPVEPALPTQAQVVVIGAGVVGASVAYHLAKMGCPDVLLLERKSIGCGTSWHSLGVVGLLRAGPTLTQLAMETARLLPELERETGKSTGYSPRGSINVTGDPARMTQFRRVADIGRSVGLEVEEIDAAEAQRLWPLLNPEGLIGGIHLPTEGQCNPLDLAQAYVAGARARGVAIRENTAVTDLELRDGRVTAVETAAGRVLCEQVVNCSGLWGRDFLRHRGLGLPLQAVEHNYLVTEFIEAVPEGTLILRDPDIRLSVREDARQLSVGFNEEVAKLFGTDGVPEDFCFEQLPPDWEAAMPYLQRAMQRVPILHDAGIRLFLCGPESCTPDTRYLLGPMPGLSNYFVAAGFSGVGIGSSGGAGRALAEWLLTGRPQADLWDVDLRRMMPFQSNRAYLEERATEAQGNLFGIGWPHLQHETARGLRRSPLHGALAQAGACFGAVAGWEVADWFAPEGVEPRHHYSFERPAWFPYAEAEVGAAMAAVAFADRSHVSKFLVLGPGAEAALSGLCASDPAVPVGTQILTPLLDERGGIEALMTLVRRSDEEFLLLSESATQVRDFELLRRALAGQPGCSLVDVTSAYAAVEIMGPAAAETLARAGCPLPGDCDISASIGCAPALLLADARRVVPTWTAIAPTEFAAGLLETLQAASSAAGSGAGARLLGRHAHHYIRTVSRIPVWPQAISSDDTALEAGLGALVDLGGERAFVGREACLRQMESGVTRRLVALELRDPEAVLLGHEPVLRGGSPAGAIHQAAYALGGGGAIGLACIACRPDTTALAGGDTEVLVAGRRVPARFAGLVEHGGARAPADAPLLAAES